MLNCITCSASYSHPIQVFGERGVYDACPHCQAGIPKPIQPEVQKSEPTVRKNDNSVKKTSILDISEEADVDVISLVKDRLAVVEKKIDELRKYETEAAKLRKMIASLE